MSALCSRGLFRDFPVKDDVWSVSSAVFVISQKEWREATRVFMAVVGFLSRIMPHSTASGSFEGLVKICQNGGGHLVESFLKGRIPY